MKMKKILKILVCNSAIKIISHALLLWNKYPKFCSRARLRQVELKNNSIPPKNVQIQNSNHL